MTTSARSKAARSADADPSDDAATSGLRIGEVAARAGVSTRTLRYYEERGIFQPTVYTAGGERRYDPSAADQLRRILELRDGLGLALEEVRAFIESERRLGALKSEFHGTAEPALRRRLLEEVMGIRTDLVKRIDAKMEQLQSLRAELEENLQRNAKRMEELESELRSSSAQPPTEPAQADPRAQEP